MAKFLGFLKIKPKIHMFTKQHLLLLLPLLNPTTALTLRKNQGVGANSPPWATHFGGGQQQVDLLNRIIDTSCETNLALPFIRENILIQPKDCPEDDDGRCFAAQFLLEAACPKCPLIEGTKTEKRMDKCDVKKMEGTNGAKLLIHSILERKVQQQKEKEATEMLKKLVGKTCETMEHEACAGSYQCTWVAKSNTCVAEKCAFLSDRKTCESSDNECVFFGGGDKSHNPMKERSTGVMTEEGKEMKVGESGCFASPCRLVRTQSKDVDEETCLKVSYKDKSREYSCNFYDGKKDKTYFTKRFGDGYGCYDKYMNGNKKLVSRTNLGKECFKKKPFRAARKFNKGKCTKAGECPTFCGSGLCCKNGVKENGCPGDTPILQGAVNKNKWYCVQDGGRATKFVY